METIPDLRNPIIDARSNLDGYGNSSYLETDPMYFVLYDEGGKPITLSEALASRAREGDSEYDVQIGNIMLHAFSHMRKEGCKSFDGFFQFSGGIMDILLCLDSVQSSTQLKQVLGKALEGYSNQINFDDGNGPTTEKVNGYFSVLLQLITLRSYVQNYKNSEKHRSDLLGIQSQIAAIQRQAYAKFKDGYKKEYKNNIVNGSDPLSDYISPFFRMKSQYLKVIETSKGFGHEEESVEALIQSFLPNSDFESILKSLQQNIIPDEYSITGPKARNAVLDTRRALGVVKS
jgi:hypothetical protein